MLETIPLVNETSSPYYDLSTTYNSDINGIVETLSGWQQHVFILLNTLQKNEFSTQEVKFIADQLKTIYPKNNNRQAKIRQILQQLRDLGLVEFTSPGNYRILWVRKPIIGL